MAQQALQTTLRVFDRPFMLTGEYVDPINVPYEKMLHALFIRGNGIDITEKQWYISYDDQSGQLSGMAVRNTLNYTYDVLNNPVKLVEVTEWLFDDGTTGVSRELVTVFQ